MLEPEGGKELSNTEYDYAIILGFLAKEKDGRRHIIRRIPYP